MKVKKHASIRLAIIIGIMQIVLLISVFYIINANMTSAIDDKAVTNMKIIAQNHAAMVDQFLSRGPDYLDSFAIDENVYGLFDDVNDEEKLKKAQEITEAYARENPALEGIYIADWDGNVLTHSIPSVIGIRFASGDNLLRLRYNLRAHKKSFCYGVGERHVMSSFRCIYGKDGEPIGMVGLAYYLTDMENILESLSEEGLETAEHTILDTVNNRYVYDSHKNGQPGVTIEDKELLSLMETMKEDKKEVVFEDVKNGVNYYAASYYQSNRDWVYIVYEQQDEILSDVYKIRRTLLIIGIICAALFPLIMGALISRVLKPLNAIRDTIERLDRDDYSKDYRLEKLKARNDEFGAISKVVDKLSDTLESKDEVYTEMLKTQSSGFLSLTYETEDIVLINLAALKLLGIEDEENIPKNVEGLYDVIDEKSENNSEKLKEIVDSLKMGEDEKVTEYMVTHSDNSSVYTLVHGKCVELSSKKKVLMFSLTDITEKKEAEDELIHLSETDALTGILNRRKGEELFKYQMINGVKGLFLLFDINKFKHVNDNFGHQVGDEVLIAVAKVMLKTFRASDICIRLGGDEYVVFAGDIETKEIGESVIKRFLSNIEKIHLDSLGDYNITISLGAVLCDEPIEFSQAYAKADSLMYDCKSKGGNAYAIYNE